MDARSGTFRCGIVLLVLLSESRRAVLNPTCCTAYLFVHKCSHFNLHAQSYQRFWDDTGRYLSRVCSLHSLSTHEGAAEMGDKGGWQ